jgi:Methyltransferase domain
MCWYGRRVENQTRLMAGDTDYDRHGEGYLAARRTDPRIEARLHAALGEARTVINVGAGPGAYEPADRYVVAVEPSPVMRGQRPPRAVPAVDATAQRLPFDAATFDAGMATITVHQWSDLVAGLRELRRVVRGPVAILTFEQEAFGQWWLTEYAPEMMAAERRRYPSLDLIAAHLGRHCTVQPVAVPGDCTDGFLEAYYARPERLLDPAVRRAQSAWTFVDEATQEASVARLREALESGAWDARHGHLRAQPEFLGALRLVVGVP